MTALVAIAIVAWQYINRPPPPTSAWEAFLRAVTTLQETGDRKLAAEQFGAVETMFPDSEYKTDSLELAQQLRVLIAEDRAWREPSAPQQLPVLQQIQYHIHHLRDVNCYQLSQPGMCHVLSDFGTEHNAAKALHEIGEPAIPHLMALLKDRRPIRSVGYWRSFAKHRTVLRYQDAAIQILNELLPEPAYNRASTSAYFSTESKEKQAEVIGQIQNWWKHKSAE